MRKKALLKRKKYIGRGNLEEKKSGIVGGV